MKPATAGRWRAGTHLLFVLRVAAAIAVVVPLLLAASVAGVALAAAVALLVAGSFVRWILLLLIEEPEFVAPPPDLRVAVVTTIVPAAESMQMLERTLVAMLAIRYPHDTWLLDEGDDEAVIDLCRRLGVRHFSRKRMPQYQAAQGRYQSGMKHGNYNAWLSEAGFASYDVLTMFDPDHVPDTDFLNETLGQLADPRIAYVQSPQEYYNESASLIARGCGEESRDFYWISQRAYHRFRTPSVIGAHGVHRLSALQALGGLAPHIADDLLLTLRYQLAGWRGAYVPKILARGLAPVDWPTYLKQQRRWATSLFDIKFRLYPRMARALPLRSRIVGFLQGLTYAQDGAAALCVAVALGAILVAGVPESLASAVLNPAVWAGVAILLLSGLYPHLAHGPHRNFAFNWRGGCLRLVKWPYTLLALTDVVRRRDRGYELTAKVDGPASASWASIWPHLLICGLVGATWILGVWLGNLRGLLPHGLAVLAVLPSLLLIGTSFLRAPAAFDPALRRRGIDDSRR